MIHIVKQIPTDFIILDNGAEFEYHELCKELQDMQEAGFTQFNLNDNKDKLLYEFIISHPDFNENVGDINRLSCEDLYPRIYWNNNYDFIEDIYNEVMDVRFPEEKEM